MHRLFSRFVGICLAVLTVVASPLPHAVSDEGDRDHEFFERRIRPLLIDHCYECHSEQEEERQGGLLLDRQSGWLEGGDTGKAVIPGDIESSLLIRAIRYQDDDLQMPPDQPLDPDQIKLLERWVENGATSPDEPMGESEFTRLGDQDYLFREAARHWAFLPVRRQEPPHVVGGDAADSWTRHPIDRFLLAAMQSEGVTPSRPADAKTLLRRMHYDLTGLPPTQADVESFAKGFQVDRNRAIDRTIDRLMLSPEFGQHIGRMWLDVARYADTDSAYRPDTKTPHYFPFAFTYRDYVVEAFNSDKPYDRFLIEQLAADLTESNAPSTGNRNRDKAGSQRATTPPAGDALRGLGFLTVGPHANRAQAEALDDWIDVTTRGLMGVTVACARCHDHKFEPVPTADYYALRGVFASLNRVDPLDENRQPLVDAPPPLANEMADYRAKRAKIDAKIKAAGNKKAGGNNRSVAEKIRETELAELLLFHPGAPTRTMIVTEKPKPARSFVLVRGDAASRGEAVSRRFLQLLDPDETPFTDANSGRLQLARKITDPKNPLTARVMVNRVWGHLMGSHLVATPSDFGLQGSRPTHPRLLDWLADDFVAHDWSVKHLVRRILRSDAYAQSSGHRAEMAAIDAENRLLWRANRKHLSIESIRDSMLAVSGQLDRRLDGRAAPLWKSPYTHRRALYGFINRFNLDPTLRAFDFPTPMQTQPGRGESIVAPQSLFTLNAPFVIDRAAALTSSPTFAECEDDRQRIDHLFGVTMQREASDNERERVMRFVEQQQRLKTSPRYISTPWPLVAQALLMSNEFQYVD